MSGRPGEPADFEIGLEYHEVDQDFIWWIRESRDQPLCEQVSEMDRSNPIWLTYVEQGVDTAIYINIPVGEDVWGFMEVCESRKPRHFTEEELITLCSVASQLGKKLQHLT